MKKLFVLTAVLLALALSPSKIHAYTNTSYASAHLDTYTVERTNVDLRVQALKNIFAKHNSPLVDSAEFYVQTADKYGIDWKLLPAIAGLESTFGKAMIDETHNAYGWGGGKIYFDTWEEGIDTILSSLNERYIKRGAVTVPQIGAIYAESPTWAVRVEKFMDEIGDEYHSVLLASPLALAI